MDLLSKLIYSQNWNIGFCEMSPEKLIQSRLLNKIQWMKHPYKDHWFADPFILKVTDNEITVFVEECQIENPKGIICELVVDRKTKKLKNRFVLLELDTHLSYPAIIKSNNKIYVYPENGASGKLIIYEYDETTHKLINPVCILDEALADATICEQSGKYYLITTKVPETQERAFLYVSNSLFGPYVQTKEDAVQTNRSCSRPGGSWFYAYNLLYRPAQDCIKGYGAGLSIMGVNKIYPFQEMKVFSIYPSYFKYNLGIHTINFFQQSDNGVHHAVVDSYGYLHPIIGRLYYSKVSRKIIYWIKRIINR